MTAGELTVADGVDLPQARVERPKNREHGDWATTVAMQVAKKVGRPPRDVAQILSQHLCGVPGVKAVDIAGPGFLNITLDAAAAG